MSVVHLTRRYRFCAGHRLVDPRRDDAWNRSVFGKCSLPGGHGHNYSLEVTVRGEPDPDTGWVISLAHLDELVEAAVLEELDHQNLNERLGTRFGPAPTTEVLILEVWEALAPRIPLPAGLHSLRISETTKNAFEYLGPATS